MENADAAFVGAASYTLWGNEVAWSYRHQTLYRAMCHWSQLAPEDKLAIFRWVCLHSSGEVIAKSLSRWLNNPEEREGMILDATACPIPADEGEARELLELLKRTQTDIEASANQPFNAGAGGGGSPGK